MNLKKISIVVASAAFLAACGDDGTNGTNGTNGANGLISLVVQTELNVGNDSCANGGLRIDSGVDADDNGSLDDGEISETNYVCTASKERLDATELLSNLNNQWFLASSSKAESNLDMIQNAVNEAGVAKNVILFIGDGMGISTVTAARILEGQNNGMLGEENSLSFGEFPFAGLAKTYNVDAQTPDSAGTMTAMMTGVKTDVGVIGVGEDIVRGDCSTVAGNELVTALELAEIAGKSTGIVSTARITHATPAATYANSADRNWEDISDFDDSADHISNGGDCTDIALQLVEFETNLEANFAGVDVDGIEVVLGGGRRHFLPNDDEAANSIEVAGRVEGDRSDSRDLTEEWQVTYDSTNAYYVETKTEFEAVDADTTDHLFGLFNESHMRYEADRENDVGGEPSIAEMTEKAIDILDNNDQGFFLMVESGRIDHAHHAGNASGALTDTIAFADAVQAAVDSTDPEETLIIVTADHGHVFTIAGYPKRGNPILGNVVAVNETEADLAGDDMPYTALGYMNGRGFADLGTETDSDVIYGLAVNTGRQDLTGVDVDVPGYHQEALIPLGSETHSGEDVGVYATGPSAHLVNGTNEQNLIFHVMNRAADLISAAETAL